MVIEDTIFEGVFVIHSFYVEDERGVFVKVFNDDEFSDNRIDFVIKESYYSISNKDVIRGMHFQMPPYEHAKLVYVVEGAIVDVLLDLRKESKTFMKYISFELSGNNHKAIFIPKGIAHGFKSLVNNTITVYSVSSGYSPDSDAGIRYDSFGYNWDVSNPILSNRDKQFLSFSDFSKITPF